MKKSLGIVFALALVLVACTFPGATEEGSSPEELALTIIAQSQTAEAAAFTATPEPPTETPTPESSPTPSVPMVSVSVATNCRIGPDVVYDLVLVFQPGATAEIVGKYQAPNYWIIKTPTNDTCWLWGEYATVDGDTSTLPEMAPPPPPVVEEPTQDSPGVIVVSIAAPSNFTATASCQILDINGSKLLQGKMDTLAWSSVNGATGYKIYINGVETYTVGTTSKDINALKISGEYGIAAYNDKSTSSIKTIPVPGCP